MRGKGKTATVFNLWPTNFCNFDIQSC